MKQSLHKNRAIAGETITEILAALLVIVLTFSFMATSFARSANILKELRAQDNTLYYDGETRESELHIHELGDQGIGDSVKIILTEDNGYYYYSHP